ncbi:MAG TPA: ABC-2 family transporter protein [Acidimicrobiales bacterium]
MTRHWFALTMRSAGQRVFADRAAVLVKLTFYVIVVTAIGSLWRGATDSNGGEIVGYTAAALFWYVATSEAAIVPLTMRMIEEIGDDIAGGAIAVELLRPASVLGVRLATEIGRGLTALAPIAVIGAVLAAVTVGAPPSALGAALAIPALVLAITCNVMAQHAVAAAAFWVRDARSVWFIYYKCVFVVGGMLLPLQVLPDWLQSVAFALPFSAMAYAPARLASGHVEPWLLLVQLGWLGVAGLAAWAAFSAGQRRLQVVGG